MEHGGSSGRDWEEAQWRSAGINLAPQADAEPLPEKFDLRDYGVVTPVKNQSPWGSCWAFGAIAASETSILSELGLTYNDLQLDLSERQLAYFSGTPLPNAETMTQEPAAAPFASQAGEGITPRATFAYSTARSSPTTRFAPPPCRPSTRTPSPKRRKAKRSPRGQGEGKTEETA
jgi:hypothetical protein